MCRMHSLQCLQLSLQCLQLAAVFPNALSLMSAIEQSSLPNDRKKTILDCVDGITTNESSTRLVQACQVVNHLSKYLSTQDWTDMAGLTTDSDVLSLVGRRMKQMGLNSLREDTKKQVVQILLHWRSLKKKPVSSPMDCYTYAGTFQTMWKQLQVDALVPPRKVYPVDPNELGKTWLSSVYGSTDSPGMVDVSGLPCPVRSTHTAIRQKSAPKQQGQQWGMEAFMQMLLQQYAEKWQTPTASAPPALPPPAQPLPLPAPPVHSLKVPTDTPGPATSEPAPLASVTTQALQTPQLPVGDSQETPDAAVPTDLESFEKKAFAALTEKSKGKAAAKAKASGKATAKANAKATPKAFAKAAAKATATDTAKATAKAKPMNESKTHWVPESGCFGCTRCRGNPKGCSQCWKELLSRNKHHTEIFKRFFCFLLFFLVQETYSGKRFNGRHDWVAWEQKKKQKTN